MPSLHLNFALINPILESIQDQLLAEELNQLFEACEAEMGEALPSDVKSASREAFGHTSKGPKGIAAFGDSGLDPETHRQSGIKLHAAAAEKAKAAGASQLVKAHQAKIRELQKQKDED